MHSNLLCFPFPPAVAFSCRAPLQKPAAGGCWLVSFCSRGGDGEDPCSNLCSALWLRAELSPSEHCALLGGQRHGWVWGLSPAWWSAPGVSGVSVLGRTQSGVRHHGRAG